MKRGVRTGLVETTYKSVIILGYTVIVTYIVIQLTHIDKVSLLPLKQETMNKSECIILGLVHHVLRV